MAPELWPKYDCNVYVGSHFNNAGSFAPRKICLLIQTNLGGKAHPHKQMPF